MRNTAVAVNDGLRYILISSNNKFALDEVKVFIRFIYQINTQTFQDTVQFRIPLNDCLQIKRVDVNAKQICIGRGKSMENPWKEISLADYENHMKLDSVMQLQVMNEMFV